ncbi:cytidylate kinase [Frankia torreyi]|uniref:Cytidylate kinase n=1 Tax=Frankia torreyi TaxID=1856 RepID=A0A0D8BAB9_9ACTN|nr:cytidylate kinase family protein [Frankia torreyi]KJE21203.1 cytidylate kinase [Frankia torreyi]
MSTADRAKTEEILPDGANVAFAGLTAAGKTTHARLLASELGYGYVSATEVLLDILGTPVTAERAWLERYNEIQRARAGDAADEELDRRLLELAASRRRTVFDTWALAWLAPGPLVRIWIESDPPSRARKCLVSQTLTRLSLAECDALVREKDSHTRDSFARRHRFDLYVARDRYDLVLCNSHLIPTADRRSADRGIAVFAPIVHAAVTALLGGWPPEELARLKRLHPAEILRIGRLSTSRAAGTRCHPPF